METKSPLPGDPVCLPLALDMGLVGAECGVMYVWHATKRVSIFFFHNFTPGVTGPYPTWDDPPARQSDFVPMLRAHATFLISCLRNYYHDIHHARPLLVLVFLAPVLAVTPLTVFMSDIRVQKFPHKLVSPSHP